MVSVLWLSPDYLSSLETTEFAGPDRAIARPEDGASWRAWPGRALCEAKRKKPGARRFFRARDFEWGVGSERKMQRSGARWVFVLREQICALLCV